MWPKDNTDPRASFVGIDFTVEVRTPGVFHQAELEKIVESLVLEFFQQRHIVSRPCFQGGLGATAGDAFIEMLNWLRENWEILAGMVTALTAAFYRLQRLAARERLRLTNGIIDPYRPGIVITVSPRTGALGDDTTDEDRTAFPFVISLLPQLHRALADAVTTHDFSLRAIRRGRSGSLNAFFKLKSTTDRDVAVMLRKIELLDKTETYGPTILLYRQFGLFRRFDVSKKPRDFYRLSRR